MVLIHATVVDVVRFARLEDTDRLKSIDVAKVSCSSAILDDRVPADVDEGAIAEEGTAGTEGVRLHRQRFERVRPEVVQRSPGGMTRDGKRVVLDLVDDEGMSLRDDRQLHSMNTSRAILDQRPLVLGDELGREIEERWIRRHV